MNPTYLLGRYIQLKYRKRIVELKKAGTPAPYFVVARQLRKQGIPLSVARLILL